MQNSNSLLLLSCLSSNVKIAIFDRDCESAQVTKTTVGIYVYKALYEKPFDLEIWYPSQCDVGYLCANFGLPRPLCSRLRPDVALL